MKKIPAIVGFSLAAIVIISGGFYYFSHKSKIQKEDERIIQGAVEKEYGIKSRIETGTPTEENTKTNLWALNIYFSSLGKNLVVMDGKEETRWMDHVRFDRELTEFEQKERAELPQTKARWQAIIDDPTLSVQMIDQIQNVYSKQFEDGKAYFQRVNEAAKGLNNQYEKDVFFITEAIIGLADANLQIKQETIKGIRAKDVDKTVAAANDEDRVSLVLMWHQERFEELMKK